MNIYNHNGFDYFKNKIILQKLKDLRKIIKKNSPSHHLGYLHSTKRIIKGVDHTKAKRFNLPKNNSVFFDSNLIHGAGTNM